MKFLIVLASVFSVGLCQLVGGRTQMNPTEYAQVLKKVFEAFPGLAATPGVTVEGAQVQVKKNK